MELVQEHQKKQSSNHVLCQGTQIRVKISFTIWFLDSVILNITLTLTLVYSVLRLLQDENPIVPGNEGHEVVVSKPLLSSDINAGFISYQMSFCLQYVKLI